MARAFPLLILLLAAFALEPVLRAGLTAADYRWLLAEGGHAVQHGWAALERVLHGVPAAGSALPGGRGEALVLVVLLALGTRALLVRLTEPWIGSVQASLAGSTAAGLVVLHPLAPALVAGLPARADLLGATLLAWAAALYVRGRQERDGTTSLVAFTLMVASGFAIRATALGVVLVAGSEYVSARRHRSRPRRLRTSATAAIGAGLTLQLATFLGLGPDAGAEAAGPLGLAAVEGLGWLLLPPSGGSLGMAGSWLAAGMAFFAVQPVFRAARHAPRLWGALFGLWVVLLAAGLWGPVRSGAPARLDRPGPWIGALVVLAAGMGLAASAKRGGRGAALRVGLVVAAAVLARANALAFREAGRLAARLSEEMGATPRRMLVLDPDPPAFGVEIAGDALGWLRHPEIVGIPAEPRFDPRRTAATSTAGLLAFLHTGAFAAWRADGLDVLLPRESAGPRRRVRIPEAWKGPATRTWRTSLTQRFEPELDPLEIAGVRVRADVAQDPREIGTLAWEARDSARSGVLEGGVRPQGGELVGLFDLSSSLEWRLAGAVRSLVLEQAIEPILQAELLEQLPGPEQPVSPEVVGGDWWFSPWSGAHEPGAAPVLVLLDLEDLACREVPVHSEGGRWVARGVEPLVVGAPGGDAALYWALEYRVDGRVLSRAEGHAP